MEPACARVTKVLDGALLLDCDGYRGAVPLAELTWDERIRPGLLPRHFAREGDTLEVVVMGAFASLADHLLVAFIEDGAGLTMSTDVELEVVRLDVEAQRLETRVSARPA